MKKIDAAVGQLSISGFNVRAHNNTILFGDYCDYDARPVAFLVISDPLGSWKYGDESPLIGARLFVATGSLCGGSCKDIRRCLARDIKRRCNVGVHDFMDDMIIVE